MNLQQRLIQFILPYGVLLCVAGPFLLIAVSMAVDNWRMLRAYATADGTVIDHAHGWSDDPNDTTGTFYPIVRYQPEDRRPHTFTDPVGSYPADYAIGETVPVLYNPADLSDARIPSWKRLWLLPTIFGVVGLLPLITAGLVAWWWGNW